jgi:hypothetical protein
MKIEMNENFEITEEIIKIASGYDFYTSYIDNYGQMMEAKEKNTKIMVRLNDLGVKTLKR